MKEIERLYEREVKEQEVRANKAVLKCLILFVGVFFVVWVLTVLDIFIVGTQPVTIAFAITAAGGVAISIYYFTGNMASPKVKYIFLGVVIFICNSAVAILSYHAVFLYILPLLFAVQYRSKHALWYTSISNCIAMLISAFIAFHYGLCDLNIFVHSNKTYQYWLEHYNDGILQAEVDISHDFVIFFYEWIPRTMIIIAFTAMLNYMINNIRDDTVRIASLTYGKDVDLATRMYNKNKYEEMIETYYPNIEHISVVFIDLNDLKSINDKYGHDAGDIVIENTADAIRITDDERYKSYRVGGDEFVVIIESPDEYEIKRTIAGIRMKVGNIELPAKGKRASVAVGHAEGRGADIVKVIKEADERMYADKELVKGQIN